jgi:hypothetical protein
MKLLATILSVYILFLTVVPLSLKAAPISTKTMDCKKSCCSNEHDTKKPANKDCCNICNPFMVCCNCAALTNQAQRLIVPFVYSTQKFTTLSETDKLDFSSDAWNPPKVA